MNRPDDLKQEARKKFELYRDELGCCGGDSCPGYKSHEEKIREFLDSLIDQTLERVVEEIKKMPIYHPTGSFSELELIRRDKLISSLLPTQSITDTSKPKEYCQCKASGGTGFACSVCHKLVTFT